MVHSEVNDEMLGPEPLAHLILFPSADFRFIAAQARNIPMWIRHQITLADAV